MIFCRDINPLWDLRYTPMRAIYLRCDMSYGREIGIYIISHLPKGKYIAFAYAKNIALRSNISQKRRLMPSFLMNKFLFSKSLWIMVFGFGVYNLDTAERETVNHYYRPTVLGFGIELFAVQVFREVFAIGREVDFSLEFMP